MLRDFLAHIFKRFEWM